MIEKEMINISNDDNVCISNVLCVLLMCILYKYYVNNNMKKYTII